MPARLKVLVIDVGGTNVKVSVTGQKEPRKFASSARLTPRKMVAGVKAITKDWKYDARVDRLPGRRPQRTHRRGAVQPRERMGRLQLSRTPSAVR